MNDGGIGGAELGQAVDAMVDATIVGEWGPAGERKINVVLRLRDGRVQVSREPLPEMPAELKTLFQERK